MKIVHIETVLSSGAFAASREWADLRAATLASIGAVDWPDGSGRFTIYPELGKKRHAGNGVKPIKEGLMRQLERAGWQLEQRVPIAVRRQPGKIDAVLQARSGPVALEWETGNISSSHRAVNKMALGLLHGVLVAGMLVVPSRALYRFLTDRIGNWDEIEPYIDLWRSVPVCQGVLEIVVVEHDATSTSVPRIKKGTDGRAIE